MFGKAVAAPEAAARRIVDAAVLLLVLLFLGSQFPPRLVFSPTIATGGDTPSHYYTVLYLKRVLLPAWRISGWSPSHYAGFPLLEFYFPLPFLLMVAWSVVVPTAVAFKLGTLMGVLLLPPCAYGCLRAMRVPFPGPALAAVLTLPFLFSEGSSMWGGNISSVLAGEFAYSLGLALTVLWLGSVARGITTGTGRVRNAVLLALIGFSHGYSLLFAGAASLFFLFPRRTFLARFLYLSLVCLAATALMAGWLLPLLAHAPWTTPYEFTWDFTSWKEIAPPILLPIYGLAGGTILWELGGVARGRRPGEPTLYLLTAALASVVWYLIAPILGVVDVRFVPFVYICVVLLAALGLSGLASRLSGKLLVPFLALALTGWWVGQHTQALSAWISWNYSGFEQKPLWPVHAQINARLAGTFQDPRVMYEHSVQHDALGSIRTWESLPVFTGRSTLEHAYFQASPSAPFVFYLQSEVSKQVSCPFPEYGCTRLDVDRAADHLRLFNVRELLVISDEAKAQLQRSSSYRLVSSVPPYDIYELTGPHAYVEPLRYEPVLWTGGRWKETSYAWFRNAAHSDVHLIFPVTRDTPPPELARLASSSLDRVPIVARAPNGSVGWERLTNNEIVFETSALHQPHLIKVSYHPNWQVEGAKAIYLASPAFMLVYPERSRVRLFYTRSSWERIGWAIAIVMAGTLLWLRRWRPAAVFAPRAVGDALWWGFLISLTGVVILGGARASWMRANEPPALVAKINQARKQERFDEVRRLARRILEQMPQSLQAEYARYQLGIVDYLQHRWPETIREFQGLIDYFPDSHFLAEAYWHIGLCAEQLGDAERMHEAVARLLREFPQTPWAGYARQRWPALLHQE